MHYPVSAMCDFLETPATALTLALSPQEREQDSSPWEEGLGEGFAPLREATVYTQVLVASFESAYAP